MDPDSIAATLDDAHRGMTDGEKAKFQTWLQISDARSELVALLLNTAIAPHQHCSLSINCKDLIEDCLVVCQALFRNPEVVFAELDQVAVQAQQDMLLSHPLRDQMSLKACIHIRVRDFADERYTRVPRAVQTGKLIEFKATVIRTSAVKMLEYAREFVCTKCRHVFTCQARFEEHNTIPRPASCPNQLDVDVFCDSRKFELLNDPQDNPRYCRDYQEIKVQEEVQQLDVGTIPRSIWVIMENDLVDACKAGDEVVVNGIVKRRWMPVRQDMRCEIETVILANHVLTDNVEQSHIKISDEDAAAFKRFWEYYQNRPFTARNILVSSFCPQLVGVYVVKLAVLLVVVGGVPQIDAAGSRTRGESHLLLVGDPGTGKSQFLKYAAKLIPRSVMTTGIGSTSAGLTVTAVKDGAEWTLEAGALVLADGGICCIDEFNGIREHDRGAIHEAMEQQTLSVAKAGLVCKLNTRTTVLAATNPKGSYDPSQSLSINVALASPLLSRFDIILVLIDTKNAEWDDVVSSFILNGRNNHPVAAAAAAQHLAKNQRLESEGDMTSTLPVSALEDGGWTLDQMKLYMTYIKQLTPKLTPKAEMVLSKYYQLQRLADSRSAARTTIRLLNSLVRLAQAHARLMLHHQVDLMDAVVAVTVMEVSMEGGALLGSCSPLHSAFPENAEEEYNLQQHLILERLGLLHLEEPIPIVHDPPAPDFLLRLGQGQFDLNDEDAVGGNVGNDDGDDGSGGIGDSVDGDGGSGAGNDSGDGGDLMSAPSQHGSQHVSRQQSDDAEATGDVAWSQRSLYSQMRQGGPSQSQPQSQPQSQLPSETPSQRQFQSQVDVGMEAQEGEVQQASVLAPGGGAVSQSMPQTSRPVEDQAGMRQTQRGQAQQQPHRSLNLQSQRQSQQQELRSQQTPPQRKGTSDSATPSPQKSQIPTQSPRVLSATDMSMWGNDVEFLLDGLDDELKDEDDDEGGGSGGDMDMRTGSKSLQGAKPVASEHSTSAPSATAQDEGPNIRQQQSQQAGLAKSTSSLFASQPQARSTIHNPNGASRPQTREHVVTFNDLSQASQQDNGIQKRQPPRHSDAALLLALAQTDSQSEEPAVSHQQLSASVHVDGTTPATKRAKHSQQSNPKSKRKDPPASTAGGEHGLGSDSDPDMEGINARVSLNSFMFQPSKRQPRKHL
eukprot:m.29682 g.29682  ORF g.29682 m.29682 type:complete len:1174 (+) comp9194_c0_seq2:221-3742(+)